MARCHLFALLMVALLASARAFEFMPSGEKELLKTDGGCVKKWDPSGPLECAGVGAGKLVLEPQGLVLPTASNEPHLAFVAEGCACVGLVAPWGPTNLRKIKCGDVVAIPKGWAFWAYNDGDKKFKMIAVADRTMTRKKELLEHESFFLLGEKKDEKHGSVLHGFSPDILASIWGVDESLAKKVLEAQKGAGIIKVEKKLTLPEIARAHNAFFGEFSFNLVDTQPELLVPRGGCANFVNCKKMPTLEKFKIGLSAALVKLEKGAIEVPSYMTNADAIVYVTKGKGRVNIAGPGGKNLVDKEVKCGDLFVVPKGYPVAKLAAKDDCFEMVAFTTCTFPLCMRLAGEKSVFHFLPKELFEAAMDLDEDTKKKFKEGCEKREKTIGILPPPKEKSGVDSYDQQVKEFERSFMRGFVDYVEDIVDV